MVSTLVSHSLCVVRLVALSMTLRPCLCNVVGTHHAVWLGTHHAVCLPLPHSSLAEVLNNKSFGLVSIAQRRQSCDGKASLRVSWETSDEDLDPADIRKWHEGWVSSKDADARAPPPNKQPLLDSGNRDKGLGALTTLLHSLLWVKIWSIQWERLDWGPVFCPDYIQQAKEF